MKRDQFEIVASAPGKVILFGEHFVVHGAPCILLAVDKRLSLIALSNTTGKINIQGESNQSCIDCDRVFFNYEDNKSLHDNPINSLYPAYSWIRKKIKSQNAHSLGVDIKIKSQIPQGVGLGSSGALSVALSGAINSIFENNDIKSICIDAVEAEKTIHKNTSGADCYIATYGGIIYYQKESGFRKIDIKGNHITMILIDSGKKHVTADLIEKVNQYKHDNPDNFNKLAGLAEKICNRAVMYLNKGSITALGSLMTENQALLEEIGISTPEIENIIGICQDNGSLGTKITGAGGGGTVISLIKESNARQLQDSLQQHGYTCFRANIDKRGLELQSIKSGNNRGL